MLKGNDELKLFFHKLERQEADELRPVPVINDPSQLGDVAIVEQFEKMVREIIETDDREVALLGRRLIEDILLPQYPMLRTQNPQVYNRYQKLIVLLRFLNLSIHGMTIIGKLIQENLLTALKSGINIRDKFQFILEVYHDVSMEGRIAQGLGEAMTACEEKFGDVPLIKEDRKTVPPTIGNWLDEYVQMGLSGPERRTGSLERIQFFKVSPNGQKLLEADKQWLLKIFRLYDWLRYGDSVEDTQQEEISGLPYLKSENFELPSDQENQENNIEDGGNVDSALPMGRVVAQKPPVFQEDIPAPRQSGLHISVSNPADFNSGIKLAPPLPPMNKSTPSATPVSLQKIIGKPEPPKVQDKSKIIDQKLEELKKKAGGGKKVDRS